MEENKEFAHGKGYRVLVADDDAGVRAAISLLLRRFDYAVELVTKADEVIERLHSQTYDVLLLDMNYGSGTSGEDGLELLRKVKVLQPRTPVILFTAWGTISLAVEGMRLGTFDFITKPWDNRILLERIETAIALHKSEENPLQDSVGMAGIVGDSEALQSVLRIADRVAPTQASVLILGESGTGKELIAKLIHEHSRRAKAPFVKVNLGGMSPLLFESEMFGHKRGAFTDAYNDREGRITMANKGTIFLDEIGDLDLSCQVKLLRVLQDQQYEVLGDSRPQKADVRVISATNADLAQMVATHRFREDLLYRINLITLTLPPLRDRREDIEKLAEYFVSLSCKETRYTTLRIAASARHVLMSYPWPGNVRELKNCIERAVLLCDSDSIDGTLIQLALSQSRSFNQSENKTAATGTLDRMEEEAIRSCLKRHNGNLTHVAEELGISRAALYRRMEKYGIQQNETLRQ